MSRIAVLGALYGTQVIPRVRRAPGARRGHGQNCVAGKILEIHQEQPGRIHVVLIRQSVGF